jgi:hypothetical protein
MSAIRLGSVALLASVLLSGCAAAPNGVYVNPWSPWGIAVPTVPTYPPATPAPVTYVDVYKYQGSRQCENGGIPIAEMQRQLQASGAIVTASSCGMDGMAYPAFCGGADGKINIFTVTSNSMNTALSQGFMPITNLASAQKVNCYGGGNPNNTSTNNNTGVTTTYPYAGTSGDSSYYSYRLKP